MEKKIEYLRPVVDELTINQLSLICLSLENEPYTDDGEFIW